MHPVKRARGKDPLVQRQATHTEWVIRALAGAGAVAVHGNGETVDAESRHGCSFGVH
ncbi:MAG: hypothetical protein LZF60_170047 [Nitrospira sp.]|nr:MAG: hypothetical protein LZF60_170047 [Nitrospira sp.]